jgi:hypothetical protein
MKQPMQRPISPLVPIELGVYGALAAALTLVVLLGVSPLALAIGLLALLCVE